MLNSPFLEIKDFHIKDREAFGLMYTSSNVLTLAQPRDQSRHVFKASSFHDSAFQVLHRTSNNAQSPTENDADKRYQDNSDLHT